MHDTPKTILAFDFGLRQIGVAVGNAVLGTSQPLPILSAKDGQPQWEQVAAILEEWQPDTVLVGDPLNMDGTVSELSQRARKFGNRVSGRFGLPVSMVDERLSSFAAKQQLREQGHAGNYKDQPADSVAAELILQTWLSERGA